MDRETFLRRLDEYSLDRNRYYIISGGALLLHGLRAQTSDIDIKVSPEYFAELQQKYSFKKSPKYDYLYKLADDFKVTIQDVSSDDFVMIDEYPVGKLEKELEWKIANHRLKDEADIRRIQAYLDISQANVNPALKEYILTKVLPEYALNEEGHQIDHIGYVVERSLNFANQAKADLDMAFTVAAYHDVGHHIDHKNHEKISSERVLADKELRKFFTEEQIRTMAEAVYDHRSTIEGEPRSVYGKIVSSADRNTTIEEPLRRTYAYRKEHGAETSLDEIIGESRQHLLQKYGRAGYAREKMYFDDPAYEQYLKNITELAEDKVAFRRRYLSVNHLEG